MAVLLLVCVATGLCSCSRSARPLRWGPPHLMPYQGFSSISCPTRRFCVAIGGGHPESYQTTTMTAGLTWTTPVTVTVDDSQGGVDGSLSCSSTRFCASINGNGFAITYQAGVWRRSESLSPAPSLPFYDHHTSCPNDTFCVSVGTDGDTYLYRDGTWRTAAPVTFPRPPPYLNLVTDVSCPTADSCTAVDALGDAYRFDGSAWSGPVPADPSPSSPEGSDHRVSCPTAAMCVAIAADGSWSRYDGRNWSPPSRLETIDHPATQGPDSLSCATIRFCAVVDDSGNAFVYNGKTWSAPIQPPSQPGQTYPTAFVSISCPTAAFCVATDGTQAWTLS